MSESQEKIGHAESFTITISGQLLELAAHKDIISNNQIIPLLNFLQDHKDKKNTHDELRSSLMGDLKSQLDQIELLESANLNFEMKEGWVNLKVGESRMRFLGISSSEKCWCVLKSNGLLFYKNAKKLKPIAQLGNLQHRDVQVNKNKKILILFRSIVEMQFTPLQANELESWVKALKNNVLCSFQGTNPVQPATVFCGTWNAGNSEPNEEELLSFFGSQNFDYDIVAIGTQECRWGNNKTFNPAEWFSRVQKILGGRYVSIDTYHLLEITLIVLVKNNLFHLVNTISKGYSATGIANVVGNKGGVGISFFLSDTSFAFVNSHLAAHQTRVEDRNADFHNLINGVRMGNDEMDFSNQFDYCYFMGDLNYRIDLERPQVCKLIHEERWDSLLLEDQLVKEMKKGNAFLEWQTPDPAFPPTYRYTRGTSEYNPEKGRIPAWCDRVLWKTAPNLPQKLLEYKHVPTVTTSDHKPVVATFEVLVEHPLPPFVDESEPLCVVFEKMSGKDLKPMDLSGFSDPYIIFHCKNSALPKVPRTRWVEQTLNPVWKETIIIPMKISDQNYIKRQYVVLQVKDMDIGSSDDPMGEVMFPLKDLTFTPTNYTFTVMNHGNKWGTISFSASLQKTALTSNTKLKKKESFLHKSEHLLNRFF